MVDGIHTPDLPTQKSGAQDHTLQLLVLIGELMLETNLEVLQDMCDFETLLICQQKRENFAELSEHAHV